MAMPAQKPGRSVQDYQTPTAFLDAVRGWLQIEQFSIDLAADVDNAVCPRFYHEADNALMQDWNAEGWAWLNPPFSALAPWVQRAWEQTQQGAYLVMLVPAGVGSNWWRDWVHDKARVLLLNGRLCFIPDWATTIDPATTKPGKGPPRYYSSPPLYPKDCCLLCYAPGVTPGYEVWTWKA